MDLRKFCLILTIVVSIILFIAGAGALYYVNSNLLDVEAASIASDSAVNHLFIPFLKNKEPFNVLLLGGDRVNKNSDTIMLANFDPETCKVNIMSIPRDTKVTIEGTARKINYAYPHGGIELAVKTVSELLDINIKYYVFIDTAAFRKIIDLLGGVDYYIPVDLHYDDPVQNLHIHLKKGQQRLNGVQAEQYVRFRKPNKWNNEVRKYYDGSDLKRNEAQQNFIKELMDQKLNLQYLPKLNSIIDVVFENLETNLTLNEIIKMTGYIGKFKIKNLTFFPMPGTTYDASPYYFLCNVADTRLIMAENFKCTDTFVDVDSKSKDYYKDTKNEPAAKKSNAATSAKNAAAKNEEGNSTKNVTKNNPSNSESSLKGKDKDDP